MSRGNRLRDWHPQTVLVEVQDKILYYPRYSFLSPCEQSYVASCESAVFYQLCHKRNLRFADSNWIKVGKTLHSHIMSIPTVGSSPDRSCGMKFNLPLDNVPFLRRTDNGHWIFQPPDAYLGDEQKWLILGRGRSVPTVTELIFVRAQRFTKFASNWIQLLSAKRTLFLWQSW